MSEILRVKEILKEKGMTQKELAELLGVHHVTLSQNLSRNPTISYLQRIATVLNVDILDLFEDTREKKLETTISCPSCGEKINITVTKE